MVGKDQRVGLGRRRRSFLSWPAMGSVVPKVAMAARSMASITGRGLGGGFGEEQRSKGEIFHPRFDEIDHLLF